MLGEKRSRAAFRGDIPESVQVGGSTAAGKAGVESTGNEWVQKQTLPSTGEAYLDSLLHGRLGTGTDGYMDNAGKATGDDRGTIPAEDQGTAGEELPEGRGGGAAPGRDVRALRTHGLFFEADA